LTLRFGRFQSPLSSIPFYAPYLNEAADRIGSRDPDEAHVLALALALEIPIWTNDRDFEVAGVTCYTTAQMLELLEII
jgi:predicted nucleic acid-binding protein